MMEGGNQDALKQVLDEAQRMLGEGGSKPKGAFGPDATPTDPDSVGLGSRRRDVDG